LRQAVVYWLLLLAAALSPHPVSAAPPDAITHLILQGAQKEADRATPYIMEYQELSYPGGDVPAGTGVCTDLVIRAFRNAGIDLQREVHEDLVANRSLYPRIWDIKTPDRNIDHRRCPNLALWFRRHTTSLTTKLDSEALQDSWKAGDVVFFVHKGATHPWHVAIISEQRASDGMPLVYDSFPPATSDKRRLDEYGPIHSHFRYQPSPASDRPSRQTRNAGAPATNREQRTKR
jgi:uncharacterized protein